MLVNFKILINLQHLACEEISVFEISYTSEKFLKCETSR